jgi:serine/threonine protein kinase
MVTSPFDAAALAAAFPNLVGLTFVASGGQKAVYRADDPQHGPVALKIIDPSADPQRGMREIQVVQHIQCSQVPRIFDTGTAVLGGAMRLWFTETWLPGQSLRAFLGAHTVTDPLTIVVARDVLVALLEAERNGIVHRDVKPDNIIVAPPLTQCSLLDFGIARHLTQTSLTSTAHPFAACTPGYAPPEQSENQKDRIDGRADLFALGVTLYECIEGTNPFRAGAADGHEMLRRVKNIPLLSVSRNLDQAGEFSQLLLAMTRLRRNHRVRSVEEAKAWFDSIQF